MCPVQTSPLVLFVQAQGLATIGLYEQAIKGQRDLPVLHVQLPDIGIGGPAQCGMQTNEDTVRWSKNLTEPRGSLLLRLR